MRGKMIATCAKCGMKNRVDRTRVETMQPVCGRCGAKLETNLEEDEPLEVTDETFARLLRESGEKPVLLDCWAPWCGPCRMIAPVLDQLAAEANGRYIVAKLNVDENQQTALRLGIQSIPTLIIFKGGKVVDVLIGAQPKNVIIAHLTPHIQRGSSFNS